MAHVLIGAGIGAATSLATGKDPMKGAMLGGVSGGLFGGPDSLFYNDIAGFFGGAGSEAASQGIQSGITENLADLSVANAVPTVGSGAGSAGINFSQQNAFNQLYPQGDFGVLSQANPYAALGNDMVGYAPNFAYGASGMPNNLQAKNLLIDNMGQTNPNLAFSNKINSITDTTDTSMMGKIKKIGTDAYDYAKENPFKTVMGLTGVASLFDTYQPQMQTGSGGGGITRGDPSVAGQGINFGYKTASNQDNRGGMLNTYIPRTTRRRSLV